MQSRGKKVPENYGDVADSSNLEVVGHSHVEKSMPKKHKVADVNNKDKKKSKVSNKIICDTTEGSL